jgi:hypothetical protein
MISESNIMECEQEGKVVDFQKPSAEQVHYELVWRRGRQCLDHFRSTLLLNSLSTMSSQSRSSLLRYYGDEIVRKCFADERHLAILMAHFAHSDIRRVFADSDYDFLTQFMNDQLILERAGENMYLARKSRIRRFTMLMQIDFDGLKHYIDWHVGEEFMT